MRKLGFGAKWILWMEACVFSSSMSVLINGSPIKDFVVGRGLRQGDPISLVLFAIVVKCLVVLVKQATNLDYSKGSK